MSVGTTFFQTYAVYESPMSIRDLVRPNIRKLTPYRCARDDFQEGILLDANENTHSPSVHDLTNAEADLDLNRYPDPHQIDVKKQICSMRGGNLKPENLYLGVGSDETIDSLIRALCQPAREKMLICPPTYGMYSVSANINDVEIVKVPLDPKSFQVRVDDVLDVLHMDPSIKLVYICSPGNPTGIQVNKEDIVRITEEWKGGVVAVDEAYIDFARKPSMAPLVTSHERLVVIQTLSKSFGLAGLRLGICYAHEPLATLLNSMKAPYNISTTTSMLAQRALLPQSIEYMQETVREILRERARLEKELPNISGIGNIIGGWDANFLLVQILDKQHQKPSNERALEVYETMAVKYRVVVRFRGKEQNCLGCLRISVGTHDENTVLLNCLRTILE